MVRSPSRLPLPLPQELLNEIESYLDPLSLFLINRLGPIYSEEFRTLLAGAFLTDNCSAVQQLLSRSTERADANGKAYHISSTGPWEAYFVVSEKQHRICGLNGVNPLGGIPNLFSCGDDSLARMNGMLDHLEFMSTTIAQRQTIEKWFLRLAVRYILPDVLALDCISVQHKLVCYAVLCEDLASVEKLASRFIVLTTWTDEESQDEWWSSHSGGDWNRDRGTPWCGQIKRILPLAYKESLQSQYPKMQKMIFHAASVTCSPVLWGEMMVYAVQAGAVNDAKIILENDSDSLVKAIRNVFNSYTEYSSVEYNPDVVAALLVAGKTDMVVWLLDNVEHENLIFRHIKTYAAAYGHFHIAAKALKEDIGFAITPTALGLAVANGSIVNLNWILNNTKLRITDTNEEDSDCEDNGGYGDANHCDIDINQAFEAGHLDMVEFLVQEHGFDRPTV
ncbi:hypothetical protein BDR26DRAFT_871521 [Obelidium mucronatum]|nr:hypothetical protein BDR26DRAFT_871521 [Obelidium mucronatum]